MDQEISKGTWVGATILAIVAILGLSFAVYGIARSLVNNSSADFVQTVDSVGNSSFNDYDGTTVSGLQVRSAIDTYEGDKICILVNTAGVQQAWAGSTTANITNSSAISFATDVIIRQEAVDTKYDLPVVMQGKGYIAYNALFDFYDASGNPISGVALTDSKEGYLVWNGMFELHEDSSNLMFNTIKTNFKTTGCTEYIANGSNFNAKLIKDASGTVVGIMFTQVY